MKILFPTTRDLCYFSADFFAEQITRALKKQGVEVVRLPLPERIVDGKPVTPDFSPLERYEGQHFDAIIDINSKLPYLEAEPGVRYLDTFDAPFINIILDHPLYHHPGLAFHLKRYYTVTIDRRHNAFIEKYYPWIMQSFYLPLAGTLAPSFEERIPRLLFPGTFEPEHCLYEEAEKLPKWAFRIVRDLYGVWNPEKEPMEEAVAACLGSLSEERTGEILAFFKEHEWSVLAEAAGAGQSFPEGAEQNPLLSLSVFPVIMNYLYPLDRLTRFMMRKRVVTALAEACAALDIQGEGWEMTDVFNHVNVHSVPPMPIGPSIETMARYRAVLDINPNFFEGLHDRVSTALINGCLTFSNMSETTAPKSPLFRHYSSFDTDSLCEQVLRAQGEDFERAGEGTEDDYPLNWDEYAERIIAWITRLN